MFTISSSVRASVWAMSTVREFATGVLGPIEYSSDLTRRAGRVVAVTDLEGGRWVIKTVPTRMEFRSELNAYTRWVPHFVDQAPRLRHSDEQLRTLILEHLPGSTGWSFEPGDHFEAGRLLRRIHEAAPARGSGADVGELTGDMLEVALRRFPDPGMLGTGNLEYARACVVTLRQESDDLPRVPCHGDYGGHNWLRDADRLWVIDFASARFNAAASDFARLFIGPWWERPDLVEAFFDGVRPPRRRRRARVRAPATAHAHHRSAGVRPQTRRSRNGEPSAIPPPQGDRRP